MNYVCIDCPMFDTAECIDCTAHNDEREAEDRHWDECDHEEDDGGDE